jgi:NADPH-dependent 2,4-dienoyl-CoA reductase/sulfur reductase-like enzyme
MIVIVGAGPAGIAAAITAVKRGAEVTVLDDNPAPGGQIWRGAYQFRDSKTRFIPNARVVWGDAAKQILLAETPDGQQEIAYDKLILATGARELFLPFPGWPGIMGVGGLQALAKGGFPLRRKRIAVAGSGPLLLAAAAYFRKAGADVVLIAEQAPLAALLQFGRELIRRPSKLLQAATLQTALLGVPYRVACHVERAEGNGRLRRLWFRSGSRLFAEEVDLAAIAWGLHANTELAELMGVEAVGTGDVELATLEGRIAGCEATGDEDAARQLFPQRDNARRFANALNRAFALKPELRKLPRPDTIVCRCEDVTFEKLQPTRSFREAKLHTRCGMGPCQGRVCGPATQFLFGWGAESVRPPVLPVRNETLICSSPNCPG